MPISVIVALGSPIATEVMGRELSRHGDHFKVVARAASSKELLKRISEHQPDVALIAPDLQDEPNGGMKVLRELHASASATRPVVLVQCSKPELVINAFATGARGVVCKTGTVAAVIKCIRSVHEGQIWADSKQLHWVIDALATRGPIHVVDAKGMPLLTKREEQIVSMVAEGLPNREICSMLNLGAHTLKNHLFHVYEKLGVSSRAELILYALSSKERPQGARENIQKSV